MCREKLEPDAMKRKPINKNASVFAFGMGTRTAIAAVNFTIVSMLGYLIGAFVEVSPAITPSHEAGMTMAYVTLAMASVINILNVRSFNQSLFTIGFASNRLLFGGICLSLTLIGVTALIPGIRDAFYCIQLSAKHWLIILSMGISPFFVIETIKLFVRRRITAANV
jgi:magnesium-transporting ATPase (P-type)